MIDILTEITGSAKGLYIVEETHINYVNELAALFINNAIIRRLNEIINGNGASEMMDKNNIMCIRRKNDWQCLACTKDSGEGKN